jgi:hypothetical protein
MKGSIRKIATAKRAEVVSRMVDQLPSKHKALSSNSSITKKRKKERKIL